MVDLLQPGAGRLQVAVVSGPFERFEIDVVDTDVADAAWTVAGLRRVLAAPAVHEIDQGCRRRP